MTGPVEFLESAHKEAERLAVRAADVCGCHPPAPAWSFRDGDGPTDGRILVVDDPHPDLKRKIGRRWNGSYEGLFMAEHIALHDPEAVLRRIAGDRKQLAEHAPVPDHGRFSHSYGEKCPAFCEGECRTNPKVCLTCRDSSGDPIEAPCRSLEFLAEGWGWTEEWSDTPHY